MDTIKGLDDFREAIEKVGKIKQAFADEFLRRVIARTPVDTGLLKDSWEMAITDGAIELKNVAKNKEGEDYVAYVEYGTHKHTGFFGLNRFAVIREFNLRTG